MSSSEENVSLGPYAVGMVAGKDKGKRSKVF